MTALDEKYSFERLVIGEGNRYAYAAATAVIEAPGKVYNPLFVYGDSGTGKTHLLTAIGLSFKKQDPNMNILYTTGEWMTKEIINAIRADAVEKMREKYREIDVLIVDDVQYIAGKEATEEEFYQLFNLVYSNNKQILLSANKNPHKIKDLEGRLVSRFLWGLSVEILPADLEMKKKILKRTSESLDFPLNADVLDHIAQYITPNAFEEEGYLKKLMLFSKSNNIRSEELSIGDADEVFSDIQRRFDRQTESGETLSIPNDLFRVDGPMIHETLKYMVDTDCYEGVKTGFCSLDNLINGFGRGELIVLGARPAMGKTTFACSIIENVCIKGGKNCIYFTSEDSKESVLQRIIRIHGDIEYYEKEAKIIKNIAEDISDVPLWINDNPAIYIDEIVEKCRDFHRNTDIALVVVDYLQLISDDAECTDTITAQNNVIFRLKSLAEELECAVLVLSQLNRSAEKRPRHFPVVKDFAAHAALGRYADIILLLYREHYYYIKEDINHATVMIAKSKKQSGIGTSLGFDPDIPKFHEYCEARS